MSRSPFLNELFLKIFWAGDSHPQDEFAMLEHYAVLCGVSSGIIILLSGGLLSSVLFCLYGSSVGTKDRTMT
jgi:hypothetical protein